jgi:hypothetical protein
LLREAYIHFCYIPSLPSTQNLSVLEVEDSGGDPDESIANFTRLSQAKNLIILRLRVGVPGDPYFLPHRLLHLKQLSFGGRHLPSNIGEVEVPNLKELKLNFEFSDGGRIPTVQIVNCKNIPFNQITTLAIEPKGYSKSQCSFVWTAYRDLLENCCNAQNIVGNVFSTPLLLRLLRLDCQKTEQIGNIGQRSLIDHTITFSNGRWTAELRSRRDRRVVDIDELASSLGWNVAVPKDRFLKEWDRIIHVSISLAFFLFEPEVQISTSIDDLLKDSLKQQH